MSLTRNQRRILDQLDKHGHVSMSGDLADPRTGSKRSLRVLVNRGLAEWAPGVGWPMIVKPGSANRAKVEAPQRRCVTIDVKPEEWITPLEDGVDDDLGAILFANIDFVINGTPMHVEAMAVETVDTVQTGVENDEHFAHVHAMARAEGHLETTTINGREYVIVVYPYC